MSSPEKSTSNKLVYMANQIAEFFESQGRDKAAAGAAEHIKKYWDPRMLTQIFAHLQKGGAGLRPVARQAIEQLAATAQTQA